MTCFRLASLAALAWWSDCDVLRADEAPVSLSLSLSSDYRIRGVSQNDRRPTPEAEIDWNGSDGWSLDARAFKVNFEDHAHTSVELDFVAGKEFDLGGTPLTLQATYYAYPDHIRHPGVPRYSLFEFSGSASHTWGAFTATAFVAWSPDYFGETGEAVYAAIGASYAIRSWLTVSGNAGEQWVARFDPIPHAGFPYANWDLGLTATHDPLSLDVRYVGTSLGARQCLLTQGGAHWCAAASIVTVTYSF